MCVIFKTVLCCFGVVLCRVACFLSVIYTCCLRHWWGWKDYVEPMCSFFNLIFCLSFLYNMERWDCIKHGIFSGDKACTVYEDRWSIRILFKVCIAPTKYTKVGQFVSQKLWIYLNVSFFIRDGLCRKNRCTLIMSIF